MTVSSPSLSLWKNRDYLRLLLAQVISLVGTGLSSVCLALLAYDLAKANASVVLSITFALKMLAYIVLAPVFSVLSQRWPKRNALVVLDLIRACLILGLPFVSEVWHVYVLMFLINSCSAAFTPLYQATLPQTLPDRENYARALSNSRIAYDMEQILSPIMSAVLLSVMSFHYLFWIDALTFLVSALLIMRCLAPTEELTSHKVERLNLHTLLDGLIGYLSQPSLRSLWYAYLATASASAMVIVNTVVYVHEILSGGSRETALAMLAVGMGSMVVAVSLPKVVSPINLHRCQALGLFLICVAFYIGTWLPSWLGYLVLCLLLGLGMSCIQTTSGLIINDASIGKDPSKLFAAHFSLTHFWWLLTYLLAGVSASLWGVAGAYWLMLFVAVISSSAFALQRVLRRNLMHC